jgi:hypothetical protein
MARRQSLLAALVAVFAIGIQTAYAAPTRFMSELRAISCCARRCDRARPPGHPNHCCGIQQATEGVGVLAAATHVDPPQPVAGLAGIPATVSSTDGLLATTSLWSANQRGAPLFLLERSLRL